MHFLIIGLLVVAIVFGPQIWAKYTFKRHAGDRQDLSGTGGELARHLLDRFDMQNVALEETTEGGDHYDPASRTVRLSPSHFNEKSLTAVAVATHEVGHAIQHFQNDPKLILRTRLVRVAQSIQRVGAGAMMIIPIVIVLTKAPAAGALMFAAGIISIGSATVIHLITLPVELDASFGKALPILREGYISPEDEQAVKRVLQAAALTYVAASLASLLNVWRWIALLRR